MIQYSPNQVMFAFRYEIVSSSGLNFKFWIPRGASKVGVVGVTTPALFGKEGNFALFSSGQSIRLLNIIYNEFYAYSCLCLLFHQMQQVTEIDKDEVLGLFININPRRFFQKYILF